jgi:hypothetical protein
MTTTTAPRITAAERTGTVHEQWRTLPLAQMTPFARDLWRETWRALMARELRAIGVPFTAADVEERVQAIEADDVETFLVDEVAS